RRRRREGRCRVTEENPGFDEQQQPQQPQQPDVPSGGAAVEDAEPQAAPTPSAEEEAAAPAGDTGQNAALVAQLDQVRTALNERTADLQRLQAEFQNYRRRVERDRVAVKEAAVANILGELLPVVDDIGRARDHGELVGGFKSVAESLEGTLAKMGLQQF